ncbi:hypothetical protein GCM10009775_04790 [Microbacterium aoyamense]|uniref:Uncharacterized protein n=1 Tax=Microbacterium aoyamense TaxID=344166 RepID=A0ABP5AKR4_9MICO|nr:hypothetical protein [Microbacterium aoyamense]
MPVPNYATPVEVYAGDGWAQTFRFKSNETTPEDLSAWIDWKSQWRAGTRTVDLAVDTSHAVAGEITVRATGAQTREMGGDGIADIQAVETVDDDPRTFVRFRTAWRNDVTR